METCDIGGRDRKHANGRRPGGACCVYLDKQKWHNIEVVVDRLATDDRIEMSRVSDSVETALKAASNPTDFRTKLALEGGDPDAADPEDEGTVQSPLEIEPDTRF